jgi:hypothetical protein
MALDPRNPPDARGPQPRHPALDYRPPLTLRLIRATLIGLIAFAVLSVAYTGFWFYVASVFRDNLPAWIERMAGTGATLAYRQLEISGYPFRFRLILHEPLLDAPAMPALAGKPLRWSAGRIVATMAPLNFHAYTIDLAGAHRIDWPGERGTQVANVTADKLTVRTDMFADGLPKSAKFEIAQLRIVDDAAPADPLWLMGSGEINAQRLFPDGEVASKPTFGLDFRIADARIPPGDFPLGRDVAKLVGEAHVVGALSDPTTMDGLSQWRDAGGIVEYTLTEGRYGPLVVNGTGTGALDDHLQPMTAGTARVEGLFPAIDALRDRDLIRSRDAAMAKVMLGVLSRPGTNGGGPTISLPYSIQNQKLFVGPVPLMALPPIQWPQARGTRPVIVR